MLSPADMHLERAELLRQNGDLIGAIDAYSAAIDCDPDQPLAYFSRGLLRSQVRLNDEALADFSTVIERWPEWSEGVEAYRHRAELYFNQQNWDGAIRDTIAALEADPTHLECLYLRANSAMQVGLVELAKSDLTHLLELEPDYFEAYRVRGSIYLKQGNFEAALADFLAYLRSPNMQNEERPPILRFAAKAALELGWLPQALDLANQAITAAPVDAAGIMLRSQIHSAMGDSQAANEDFSRGRELLDDRSIWHPPHSPRPKAKSKSKTHVQPKVNRRSDSTQCDPNWGDQGEWDNHGMS